MICSRGAWPEIDPMAHPLGFVDFPHAAARRTDVIRREGVRTDVLQPGRLRRLAVGAGSTTIRQTVRLGRRGHAQVVLTFDVPTLPAAGRRCIELPHTAALLALEEHEMRRAQRHLNLLGGSSTRRACWIWLARGSSSVQWHVITRSDWRDVLDLRIPMSGVTQVRFRLHRGSTLTEACGRGERAFTISTHQVVNRRPSRDSLPCGRRAEFVALLMLMPISDKAGEKAARDAATRLAKD
jgi:hypothetical protein